MPNYKSVDSFLGTLTSVIIALLLSSAPGYCDSTYVSEAGDCEWIGQGEVSINVIGCEDEGTSCLLDQKPGICKTVHIFNSSLTPCFCKTDCSRSLRTKIVALYEGKTIPCNGPIKFRVLPQLSSAQVMPATDLIAEGEELSLVDGEIEMSASPILGDPGHCGFQVSLGNLKAIGAWTTINGRPGQTLNMSFYSNSEDNRSVPGKLSGRVVAEIRSDRATWTKNLLVKYKGSLDLRSRTLTFESISVDSCPALVPALSGEGVLLLVVLVAIAALRLIRIRRAVLS